MRKNTENIVLTAVLLILAAVVIAPVAVMLFLSLNDGSGFTLDGYKELFTAGGEYFFRFIRSMTIAFAVTAGQTAVSAAVGFLLGRFSFRGRLLLIALYSVVLFLPYSAVLLPNYMVIREMGFLDTQCSVIIPAVFSPLGVIIMTVFISALDQETIDAALLDTRRISDILFGVVLPQAAPGIALTVIVTFTEAWNMVEQPQAMMENKLLHPLSVSLGGIFSDSAGFAGSFLYIIPPILILWSCRESVIDGLTEGKRKEKQDG